MKTLLFSLLAASTLAGTAARAADDHPGAPDNRAGAGDKDRNDDRGRDRAGHDVNDDRGRRTQFLVSAADRLAYSGLLLMGIALTGVAVIIFSAVAGPATDAIAGTCAFVAQFAFWVLLPLWARRHAPTSST